MSTNIPQFGLSLLVVFRSLSSHASRPHMRRRLLHECLLSFFIAQRILMLLYFHFILLFTSRPLSILFPFRSLSHYYYSSVLSLELPSLFIIASLRDYVRGLWAYCSPSPSRLLLPVLAFTMCVVNCINPSVNTFSFVCRFSFYPSESFYSFTLFHSHSSVSSPVFSISIFFLFFLSV